MSSTTYFSFLRENRDFRRLWLAHLISLGGDWFNSVALLGLVFALTGSAFYASVVLAANMLPHFLVSPVAGVVVDRFDRRKLMITSDVLRAVLALGMLLVRSPSTVWIGIACLAGIATLAAFFTPSSQAAIPNLVSPKELGRANVLMGSAWGAMLAIGAALGGLVATVFGRDTAFIVNSASFLVSALLIVSVRGRFSEDRPKTPSFHPIRDIAEGLRYAKSHGEVMALLATKGGFGLGAGVIALVAIFGEQVYRAGDLGIGILFGARGLGALAGPIMARAFVKDDKRKLFIAIGAAMALYGVAYAIFQSMPLLWLAAIFATIAHLGGGAQWMMSTYGLQAITPDHVRGRIFAFDFGLVTLTMSASLLIAGRLAELFDVRDVMLGLALIEIAYAGIWMLGSKRFWKKQPLPKGPDQETAAQAQMTRK
ncbi:MAG: MFS transporter [Actinobacteria bacterium]|nr:MFS transporter [Actinomycetota bacterium]